VEKVTKTIKIRVAWTVLDGVDVEKHISNEGDKAGQVGLLSEWAASGRSGVKNSRTIRCGPCLSAA
jgi:hypothetical protein